MNESNNKLIADVVVRFFTVLFGGWMAKKGFSDEDAKFIIAGIVTLLFALGYTLKRNFDLRNQAPPPKPTDPSTSNWIQLKAFLVIVPALLLMAGGCESSPAKQYASALVALDGVNTAFNSAAKAHLLTDRQIVAAEPLFKAADGQVQILQEEYATNGTVNETALKSLVNAIDAIQEWLARTKARK